MATFSIDIEKCDKSPGCPAARSCPQGAIKPVAGAGREGTSGWYIDQDVCISCGICYRACRGSAVERN